MFDDDTMDEELVKAGEDHELVQALEPHKADGECPPHPKRVRFPSTVTLHDGHAVTGTTSLIDDHCQRVSPLNQKETTTQSSESPDTPRAKEEEETLIFISPSECRTSDDDDQMGSGATDDTPSHGRFVFHLDPVHTRQSRAFRVTERVHHVHITQEGEFNQHERLTHALTLALRSALGLLLNADTIDDRDRVYIQMSS